MGSLYRSKLPRVVAALAVLALLIGLAGWGLGFGRQASSTAQPGIAQATATETDQLASWPASGGTAIATALDTSAATDTAQETASPIVTTRPTQGPTAPPTHRPTARPTARPTTPATPKPAPTAAQACSVFPSSNVWNKTVSSLPVASNSEQMIEAIGLDAYLHPDFDAIGDGIPYNVVDSSTPTYSVNFDYADESDNVPYPIPASPKIEKGSDKHMLLLDVSQCRLWELYDATKSGSSWSAGSGATWDLHSNALRPAGWTSADAAGLPIFPGLVRYEEVQTGAIDHALRFTAPDTCGYIYPARHLTAPACSDLPPMGLRVRLKASVDISGFGPNAQVVLTALKRYGMILADNGSPWYVSGAPSSHWDDDEFHQFQTLHGSDFEVVDTSGLGNG